MPLLGHLKERSSPARSIAPESRSGSQAKNCARERGMTSSRRVREFTVGLTAPCSIIEILLFVTPARRANSRWERPLRSRTHLSLCPRSNSAGGGSIIIFYQGSCSPLECQKPPLVFRLSSSMRCANRSAETEIGRASCRERGGNRERDGAA